MTEAASDPTIQSPRAPAVDATGHWSVSLAEIDAMGRKAARGAGLPWGLAEEAGRAARWLAAYEQPAPEALLAVLEAMEAEPGAHAPDADWQARAALCPIRAGAALSDRAETLDHVSLGPVLAPILLAPFLCRAARSLGLTFAIEAERVCFVAAPGGPLCANWTALRGTGPVSVTRSTDRATLCPPGAGPRRVSVETWRRLERLAHRTYVPSSRVSRARAGAGERNSD